MFRAGLCTAAAAAVSTVLSPAGCWGTGVVSRGWGVVAMLRVWRRRRVAASLKVRGLRRICKQNPVRLSSSVHYFRYSRRSTVSVAAKLTVETEFAAVCLATFCLPCLSIDPSQALKRLPDWATESLDYAVPA